MKNSFYQSLCSFLQFAVFYRKLLLMKILKTKARLLLCGVIIAAFFIPAYNNISGLSFINRAFSEAKTHNEITETDVLITIIPLLFIPFSALLILVRAVAHVSTRKTYLALPLLFMLFFFGILYISSGNTSGGFSSPKVFFQMQPGFYIAGLASLLVIFTKNYKKRRHRHSVPSTEVPVTA